MKDAEAIYVIPYSVPDNPEAKAEAIRTGNCIRTQVHGSRLPPYQPLGMRIQFSENDDTTWEHWVGSTMENEA